MVSNIGGNSTGNASLFQGISNVNSASPLDALSQAALESFAKSFDKADMDKDAKKKEQMKELMSEADTDKSGGLSLKELSSVDTTQSKDKAKLVDDLIKQFKGLDKDGNGELSMDEMQELLKQKEFSIQELGGMHKSMNNENSPADSTENSPSGALGQATLATLQKFLSAYQYNAIAGQAPSVSVSA